MECLSECQGFLVQGPNRVYLFATLDLPKIKTMAHPMQAIFKNDKLFHDKLKEPEKTTVVLAKGTFNDL